MKKIFYSLVAIATLVVVGCDNENTVNPQSQLGSATIQGFVTAQLDEESVEKEPAAGIQIVATVNTADLVTSPVGGVAYATKYYYATTGSDGAYSFNIEVPTGKSVNVSISTTDFREDVRFFNAGVGEYETEERLFLGQANKAIVSVYNGGTFIRDIAY